MRRSSLMALVLAVVSLPALVQAQRTRDHRQGGGGVVVPTRPGNPQQPSPPPQAALAVTGYSPQSGPAGTQVTITGTGFRPQTRVLFDGRPVKSVSNTPTAIVVQVPAKLRDGFIVLRQPGVANDVPVGRFALEADPVVARFAPIAGPAGSRVEITGSGFRNGDQVFIGTVPTIVGELTPNRILVTIPTGALSDFLVVARGPKQAKSARPFMVTLPPPVIARFEPVSGPPGTMVRVFGTNLAPDARARYGKRPVAIQNRGEGWVDVFLPKTIRDSQPISIKGSNGEATTAQPFQLALPPIIGQFDPPFGPPGARVQIFGANFLRGDDVRLGSRSVRVDAIEPGRIAVELPADARTDTFAIFRAGAEVARAAKPFDVIIAPKITGFAPLGGPTGTRVTISGSGFGPDVAVMFGAQRLAILARTETSVDVMIPRRATSQPFLVRTRGGEASSAQPFQVQVPSMVTSIQPASGPVGTRVWIRGRNFNPTDVFYLNDLRLAIVERQPEGYQIQIPPGAQSGVISWESYGQRRPSRFRFDVIEPPTLASFIPMSGPVGTAVTITGSNFDPRTSVFFGNLPATIIRRVDPAHIVVAIPPGAQGTDYLWVESMGQRVKSVQPFQVVLPPAIMSFSPTSGPVGTQVTLSGANFTASSVVTLGQTRLPIVRAQLPGTLVVSIPAGARGADFIWVEDRDQRVKSPTVFTVMVPPTIVGIAPLSGPVGTQVTIKGERFSPGAKVWFGSLPCAVLKRGGATELVVAIPPNATGRDYLTVEDFGQRVSSAQPFDVIVPPAQPACDGYQCDDGKHEHAHPHPHAKGDHHHHPHAQPHKPGSTHHHPF